MVLDDTFITLGNPCLEEVYKLKITAQPHKVAVMRWGNDLKEGGLIAWTDEATVVPISVCSQISIFIAMKNSNKMNNEQGGCR